MFDVLFSAIGFFVIASLLLVAALWVQIYRDIKASYFQDFASSLALSIHHGARRPVVRGVLEQSGIQLSELERRGVSKQDLATIRQCVEAAV